MLGIIAVVCAVICSAFGNPAKIVGGSEASAGQFPAIVSLQHADTLANYCGGALISDRIILSAAHCFYDYSQDPSKTVVYTGSIDLNQGGTYYNLSRIIMHSEYDDNLIINDISLSMTAEPVTLTKFVQPLNLPEPDFNLPGGTLITALGWGRNASDGEHQTRLRYVQLGVVPYEECQKIWEGSSIFDTEICVGGVIGKGVCGGDSGSPLILNNTAVGIVSWGRACAVGYPDINTRVSKYIDWINANRIQLETMEPKAI